MIDYHCPIYKFELRSIFPDLVTRFPTVEKQKNKNKKRKLEDIQRKFLLKKSEEKERKFGIVDLFLSMENGDGKSIAVSIK